jgi:serpin B
LALIVGCSTDVSTPVPPTATTAGETTSKIDANRAAVDESWDSRRWESPGLEVLNGDLNAAVTAGNAFAVDLYSRLRSSSQEILFFSPYSIHSALSMTYAGARGETAAEMARTLHLEGEAANAIANVATLDRSLPTGRRATQHCELQIANHLWGQLGLAVRPEFISLTRDCFGAEFATADFAKHTEEARQMINAWVATETREKIKDLLTPGTVDSSTRLVLTNAIYFKGQWNKTFEKKATVQAPFHVSADEKIDVPLMFQRGSFSCSAVDGMQILELPYADKRLAMTILLPEKMGGLVALEEMLTAENLNRWLSKLESHEAIVHFPRFRLTNDFSLRPVLRSLGMELAQTPGQADLSGMTDSEDLFISAVIHKAFVDVNEEGTEAAAATAVVKSAPSPVVQTFVFRADHPFVFLIRDTRTGSILFLGRMVKPQPQ